MRTSVQVAAFFLGSLFSLSAFCAATVETVTGSVRAGASAAAATAVGPNQRILPGAVVVTGPKSQTLLRFDDGQAMVLAENTEFKVAAFTFDKADPKKESYVFELARGALRSVTGLLAKRNPQAYTLRVPQATIGIRGTDFMVAVVNPAFMSVISGSIGVSNAGGVATFGAGATGTVANAATLATSIPASALPPQVASTFQQLGALPISAAGVEAAEAAAGGITGATAAAIAAGVAAAAAGGPTPSGTSTTTATGTR